MIHSLTGKLRVLLKRMKDEVAEKLSLRQTESVHSVHVCPNA